MPPVLAAILGIIQGITEFLPISSDGHLVLTQKLLGLSTDSIFFDVFVHTATLLAIIVFFGPNLIHLTRTHFKAIIISLIPTGMIGIFLNHWIGQLYSSLSLTAAGFLVTSIFLILSSKHQELHSKISPWHAVLIGTVQGLAVLPGWSRSGSTIGLALLLGINYQLAFLFSFLTAIPAIIGAQLVQIVDIGGNSFFTLSYLIGFISAATAGFFSLKLLKKIIQFQKLSWFALYTFPLAGITFLLAYLIR